MNGLNYLPLPLPFFAIIVGAFLFLILLLVMGVLRYAYMRLGISSLSASLILFASLIGSYLNIPVAQFPGQQVLSGQEVAFFGMRYVVPVVVDWPGTIIAVNVGGALIPVALSLSLLARHRLWLAASWPPRVSLQSAIRLPTQCPDWASPFRCSSRRWQRPSWRSFSRSAVGSRSPPHRSLMSAAPSGPSSAQTCSISGTCKVWARLSHRSVAPGHSTASF
jgi:hypothetical protein